MKTLWILLGTTLLMLSALAKSDGREKQRHLALVNDVASESKVLDLYVGIWKDEVTNKPTERNPNETKSTGITTIERVLNGRFTLAKSRRDPGNQEFMHLSTYDPARKGFRSWFFSPLGNGDEWSGAWDENSKTFSGKADLPNGLKGVRETHFTDKDTMEWTVNVKDQNGKVVVDVQGKSTRQKDGQRPKDEVINHAMATPAELKVLEKLVGSWDWEGTLKPAEWTPKELRTTGTLTRKWVLNGRFVQEHGGTTENPNIGMVTYDPRQQAYRFWIFEATGSATILTGQWDQAANTMTWTSDLGNGITSAGPMHFVDDDMHEWSAVAKDKAGKVYLDLGGKLKRKK